jgi:hypothetical protein
MRDLVKAVLIGLLVQGFFWALAMYGGIGPCGPTNLAGTVGMLGTTMPGMLVAMAFEKDGVPDSVHTATWMIPQLAFWIALPYFVIRFRKRDS